MDTTAPVREARSHGHKLGQSRGFCWFARFGIAARGVVYIVIGVLAVKLALGDGGKATDQQGALATIAKQPAGTILLAVGRDRPARLRLVAAPARGAGRHPGPGRPQGPHRRRRERHLLLDPLLRGRQDPRRLRRRGRLEPRQDRRRRARLARRPVHRRHRGPDRRSASGSSRATRASRARSWRRPTRTR